MATYIQGVTDYIPQIQPKSPNLNLFAKVAAFKQSKYDAAKTKLNNLYGSLLNAPMSREDNINARENFFKAISQDIHKMSGMDLSLSQNVEAAEDIFNQLTDNDQIVNDMAFTKDWQNKWAKRTRIKDCRGEDCGTDDWWEGGDRLMQYDMEDFKNATAEEAMGMRTGEYVAAQNVSKMALELAKEADFNVTQDTISGGYIVKNKNGDLIKQPLEQLFSGIIGSDPKVKAYYNARGRVSRKDFSHQNAQQYGSVQAADQAYIQEKAQGLKEANDLQIQGLNDVITGVDGKLASLNSKRNKAKREDQKRQYDSDIKNLETQKQMLGATKAMREEESRNIEQAIINGSYTGDQIDQILGNAALSRDIQSSAAVMAQRGAERTLTVEQYSLSNHKEKLARGRMALQFEVDKNLKAYQFDLDTAQNNQKFRNDLMKLGQEYKLKGEYDDLVTGNDIFAEREKQLLKFKLENGEIIEPGLDKNMVVTDGGTAQLVGGDEDEAGIDAQKGLYKMVEDALGKRYSNESDIINKLISSNESIMNGPESESKVFTTDVKMELANQVINAFSQLPENYNLETDDTEISEEQVAAIQGQAEQVKKYSRIKQRLDDPSLTAAEKLKLIDDYKILSKENINKLSPSQMDVLYGNVVPKFKEGGAQYSHFETLLSDHNADVRAKIAKIKTHDEMIAAYTEGMQSFYESGRAGVIVNHPRPDGDDKLIRKFYEEYWEDGVVKPVEQFISDVRSGNGSLSSREYSDEDLKKEWAEKYGEMHNLAIQHGKLGGVTAKTGLIGAGGMYSKGFMTTVNTMKSNTTASNATLTLIKEALGDSNFSDFIISDTDPTVGDIPEHNKDLVDTGVLDKLLVAYTNPEKKAEEAFTIETYPIAGGNSDYMTLSITPSNKFIKANMKDGDSDYFKRITITVPKDKTDNALKKAWGYETAADIHFAFNSSKTYQNTDAYENIVMSINPKGGFTVTGIAKYNDGNGGLVTSPIQFDITGSSNAGAAEKIALERLEVISKQSKLTDQDGGK